MADRAAITELRRRGGAWLAGVDPDSAAWVHQVGAARAPTPTVVVVGETKRGKSALVNALLATEDLSAVDAVAATTSYVVCRHGPEATATVHHPDGPPLRVPFERRASWVTGVEPGDGGLPPRCVELTVPVPLLLRLTVVDTPGIGGLHHAHGELAREALAAATAVLFVLDASAPIGRGELEFLGALGDRVQAVSFALTKIDLHRGWRTVLDADRALLARHAPRFGAAPVYPVSARLFARAATATPDLAPLLRDRSGVPELQLGLQQLVSRRAGTLHEANGLRVLCTAVDGAVASLHARQRALDDGTAHAHALRARRTELEAARRGADHGWQVRLRAEIQRARLECGHEVAGLIRAAHTRLRGAVEAAGPADLQQVPYQVDATLQLLAGQVAASLATRIGRLTDAVLAELFGPDEVDAVRCGLLRHAPPLVAAPPPDRPRNPEDRLLAAVGFSGGLGLGRLAALPLAEMGVGAVGALVLPFSIALGLGAGWWMVRTRRLGGDRAHSAQWLADVLAEARAAAERTVAEQMIDVEQRLALLLDGALARRTVAVEDELREVDRALRLAQADRLAAIEQVRTRLAEAGAWRREAAAALDALAREPAAPR